MKLPDFCPKIRTGQIWKKKGNDILIHITSSAHSRNGQKAWQTRRYCMKIRIGHAITEKDIWRFYELVGTVSTIEEYVLWQDLQKQKQNETIRAFK